MKNDRYNKLKIIIKKYLSDQDKKLLNEYPNYEIIDYRFNLKYQDDFFNKFNIYFPDMIAYPFLFKNNNIFISKKYYTITLNYLFRTFILRVNDNKFSDPFSEKIFQNHIPNKDFKKFWEKLLSTNANLSGIEQRFKKIIFNNEINYIANNDVTLLFDKLEEEKLLYKVTDDLYKLNFNITKADYLNFKFDKTSPNVRKNYFKIYPRLISGKFNIIFPSKSFDITKIFFWYENKFIFIPQFLVFYKGS